MFALGSLVFTGIALVQCGGDFTRLTAPLGSPTFWGCVLYLAGISSVCAFLLLNYALNHISVALSSIFSNFTTVISVLAGIFILGDSFSGPQLLGICIITLSVLGVSYRRAEEE